MGKIIDRCYPMRILLSSYIKLPVAMCNNHELKLQYITMISKFIDSDLEDV